MWERLLLRSKRCSEKPRRQREGQKYPSFGFHPHKFLPGVFTPPSLLLLSQGAFQVWEVGFFLWSISGFAQFLPDFKGFFPIFFPILPHSRTFAASQSSSGSSGVLEVMDGSGRAGVEPLQLWVLFIPPVNHGNVAPERWIGVMPGSSFP